MSASIQNSVNKLASAVVKLEKAIEVRQQAAQTAKKAPPQNDLFSAAQQGPALNPNNVRMLATRLDNAINQVEMILKEGRA